MLLKLTSTASFEHLCVRISSSSKSVIGLVVYRTNATTSLFYREFENTLGVLATYNEEVLITTLMLWLSNEFGVGLSHFWKILVSGLASACKTVTLIYFI